MKLFDGGMAPNPRRVRVFLAEKGIEIPLESIDMAALGHRDVAVTSRNPLQRLPVLELDNGTIISESVAICRYFEEIQPDPPLFGINPAEKAIVEMWQRRMEFHLLLPVANVFRHTHPAMKEWEIPQIAEFAKANRPKVDDMLKWMDEELSNRPFIAGDRFTIADITGMIAIDFMKPARISVPEDFQNLRQWHSDIKSRPSASA